MAEDILTEAQVPAPNLTVGRRNLSDVDQNRQRIIRTYADKYPILFADEFKKRIASNYLIKKFISEECKRKKREEERRKIRKNSFER